MKDFFSSKQVNHQAHQIKIAKVFLVLTLFSMGFSSCLAVLVFKDWNKEVQSQAPLNSDGHVPIE